MTRCSAAGVMKNEASRQFTAQDRSAIYGGFHLYVFEG